MLYKYPYTNLYNLNLDWLIQAVKELQEVVEPLENVVTSVNGMTGDVTLTREILTQILGGMVSKFNGRDGDVTLTAEDVNRTLIDITWTSDPGDTIDDLTQTELDALYTSGKRVLIFVNNLGVADQVYFLQYYDNHAMPQEYSPTSALAGVATFNGQTGNVTATGADLATSGTDQTTIAANLANLENTKVPNTRTVNNKPLSTNISINAEDIPSQAITGATDVEMALGNLNNSKVPNSREVNNKSLITSITLNDEDIPSQVVSGQTTVEGVLTDLDTRVSNQSQQIESLDSGIAIIVNGDTASVAVPVGGYAYIKNNTHGLAEGMYKNTSSSDFPVSGGTANSTVFTSVSGGAINDAVNALNSNIGMHYTLLATLTKSVDSLEVSIVGYTAIMLTIGESGMIFVSNIFPYGLNRRNTIQFLWSSDVSNSSLISAEYNNGVLKWNTTTTNRKTAEVKIFGINFISNM